MFGEKLREREKHEKVKFRSNRHLKVWSKDNGQMLCEVGEVGVKVLY